jgi:hypothetical protein
VAIRSPSRTSGHFEAVELGTAEPGVEGDCVGEPVLGLERGGFGRERDAHAWFLIVGRKLDQALRVPPIAQLVSLASSIYAWAAAPSRRLVERVGPAERIPRETPAQARKTAKRKDAGGGTRTPDTRIMMAKRFRQMPCLRANSALRGGQFRGVVPVLPAVKGVR